MIETYQNYLKMPQTLTTEEMEHIHKAIQIEVADDPDGIEIYEDLINAAIKYANIRAMWDVMSREEKQNQDALRTAYHNSVIMNVNMLSRYLKQQGFSTEWREQIAPGSETEGYNRKAIGDFACYLAFISGLCAR